MLRGCGRQDLSAWRPSPFAGLGEERSWMGPGLDREPGNEGNRGISHIFLSTSQAEPEHLESTQRCSGERISQGGGRGQGEIKPA